MKIEIHSLQETQEFATKMADLCRNKQLVITLDGDLGAGKTCKEIGAMNKRKEKVKNNPILKEFNKEYKRMYGLHYNHSKQFTEKKFKDWSKKAKKLITKFTDKQVEEFKIELRNLSQKYWR